jgi:hypothetical protein
MTAKGHGASVTEAPAESLDEPRVPISLYRLWIAKRCPRLMPSKADFHPAEFKRLLAGVVLMEAGPPGGPYIVRLVGENIVDFFGRTTKGFDHLQDHRHAPTEAATRSRIPSSLVRRRRKAGSSRRAPCFAPPFRTHAIGRCLRPSPRSRKKAGLCSRDACSRRFGLQNQCRISTSTSAQASMWCVTPPKISPRSGLWT